MKINLILFEKIYIYVYAQTKLIFSSPFCRRHGSVADVLRHATPVGVQLCRLQPQHAAHASTHRGGTVVRDGQREGRLRPRHRAFETSRGRVDAFRGLHRGTVGRHRPGQWPASPRAQTAQARVRFHTGHRHRQRGRRPVVQPGSAETPTGEDLETLRRHRRIVPRNDGPCKYNQYNNNYMCKNRFFPYFTNCTHTHVSLSLLVKYRQSTEHLGYVINNSML